MSKVLIKHITKVCEIEWLSVPLQVKTDFMFDISLHVRFSLFARENCTRCGGHTELQS